MVFPENVPSLQNTDTGSKKNGKKANRMIGKPRRTVGDGPRVFARHHRHGLYREAGTIHTHNASGALRDSATQHERLRFVINLFIILFCYHFFFYSDTVVICARQHTGRGDIYIEGIGRGLTTTITVSLSRSAAG